ncbi:MAG: putative Ig domain-containing protein, partial [Planctomycetes bacterium]|nr:putative Ig domain-containing protein [Planctomycetota bacterium]
MAVDEDGGGGGGGNPNSPPASLQYASNPATYAMGSAIAPNVPQTFGGGAPTQFSIEPALPTGLQLNPVTGVLTGTPANITPLATYVVTAGNAAGSTTRDLVLRVVDALPAISYAGGPFTVVGGTALVPIAPTSTGGAVASFAIAPTLPAGLTIDAGTGVITGTPTAVVASTVYTVTASNEGGNGTAQLTLTVTAPSLQFTGQPASTMVAGGATANFTAAASGTGALT